MAGLSSLEELWWMLGALFFFHTSEYVLALLFHGRGVSLGCEYCLPPIIIIIITIIISCCSSFGFFFVMKIYLCCLRTSSFWDPSVTAAKKFPWKQHQSISNVCMSSCLSYMFSSGFANPMYVCFALNIHHYWCSSNAKHHTDRASSFHDASKNLKVEKGNLGDNA